MVDSSGKATYVGYDKLSEQEKYALHHDPDYPQLLADAREKAQGWTDDIAKAVKAVDEADQSVKRALARATSDVSTDGIGIDGFNASAVGDLAKAGKPAPKATTKTDGWVSEGESEASGPGVGTSVTGPNTGAGKLGEAEAHADLGRASAEGSLTNGPMKLAGEAEAYAGAKVSASGGITNECIQGEAGAFAGGEASAKGRADLGPVGVYGRAESMAGAEASANAGAGLDGVQLGGEAFAGAKDRSHQPPRDRLSGCARLHADAGHLGRRRRRGPRPHPVPGVPIHAGHRRSAQARGDPPGPDDNRVPIPLRPGRLPGFRAHCPPGHQRGFVTRSAQTANLAAATRLDIG
ncbi:hypothetical protein [Streptomyces sp. KR55]|uniref:hypothetical protein n=1 Tax=Streptomyces sp. KR55 TaxID=3457425 RepID=UPI003FCFCF40